MAVIVNGRKFNYLSEPGQVIKAIMALPEPKVIERDHIEFEEEKAVICLQREVAYANMKHPTIKYTDKYYDNERTDDDRLFSFDPDTDFVHEYNVPNQVRYMGTKWLHTCILIYCHTDTKHMVVHIDDAPRIDLNTAFSDFAHENKLYISLIGGQTGESSESILEKIIVYLLNKTKFTHQNIIIETQKLMANNAFREQDKLGFVYDYIVKYASVLYRREYGKSLSIQDVFDRKRRDFHTRQSPLTTTLIVLATAICHASEIRRASQKAILTAIDDDLKTYIRDESTFKELLNALFSQEGFKLFDKYLQQNKYYRLSQLTNFVIDVKTNDIIMTHAFMPTPNEDLRAPVRLIRHLSILDTPVYLKITPVRYSCDNCDDHTTTTEQYDGCDRNASTTKALDEYLMRSLSHGTIEDVSKKEKVGQKVVQGILDRQVQKEVNWSLISEIETLGIDEIANKKGYQSYFTIISVRDNDGKISVIAVLPERTKEVIKYFLESMPEHLRKRVKNVCTDNEINPNHARALIVKRLSG